MDLCSMYKLQAVLAKVDTDKGIAVAQLKWILMRLVRWSKKTFL